MSDIPSLPLPSAVTSNLPELMLLWNIEATYHIDWNTIPRSRAAFTCLHIVTVTDNFPGGPGSVVAGFRHLVQLVFKHPVPMQAKI